MSFFKAGGDADTIAKSMSAYDMKFALRNYKGTNECHGWMGIRFQKNKTPPSNIFFQVRMLDKTNTSQQDALGIIGVNLVYGAFIYTHAPHSFIESLPDNLGNERIKVDMIQFNGPSYQDLNN